MNPAKLLKVIFVLCVSMRKSAGTVQMFSKISGECEVSARIGLESVQKCPPCRRDGKRSFAVSLKDYG